MKRILTFIGHFISIVLILKFTSFVLPNAVLNCYAFVCNALLCSAVAFVTFTLTKRKFLNAKVKPTDKAVFITGCDSGFGHLLAQRLDLMGFHVFAGCLFPDGTGATDLKMNCSNRLHVVEVDVTGDDSVKRAAQITEDSLGPHTKLWAIVNNAGIQKGFTVELTPMECFKEVLDVNTFGSIRVSKTFLPLLRKSKGRIVNMTSFAGRLPHPHLTPYCMSKFASQAFNDCLRMELLAFGVDVISIEPQAFESSITNPNRIRKAFDVMLESVEDDILSSYKGKYITRCKEMQELFIMATSPDIHLVINDLVSAITLVYPSPSYQTRSNMFLRISMKLAEFLPSYSQNLCFQTLEVVASMLTALNVLNKSELLKN